MMSRIFVAVLLVFGLGTGSIAHAVDKQVLVELTNSMNREIHYLSALLDAAATPTGLNVTVIDENGKIANSTNFSLAQISSPEGAVLASSAGRAAVILRGQLSSKNGGSISLKYLTNILTGSYSECQAHVRKNGGSWQVVNAYTGAVVTRARIQTWTLGIEALQGICPEPNKIDFMETESSY